MIIPLAHKVISMPATRQAFSSVSTPTLYNAIPALETLYSAWEGLLETDAYAPFAPAIAAALKKNYEYYQKTASHVMAIGMLFMIQSLG